MKGVRPPAATVNTTATSLSLPTQADGTWYFHIRAVDGAGSGGLTATYTINIDTTPPSAISGLASSTDPSQSSWYANATPAFSWNAATDATSGLAGYSYVLDQSAGTVPAATVNTTATSYTSAALADGTWYFHVRAIDNAGNAGTTATYQVNIDQTPPATTASGLSTSATSNWHTSASSFSLSASDATSGVAATYYTIDGGGTQTYAGSAVPVSGDASHTITYWSVDNAGNIEGAHTGRTPFTGPCSMLVP